MLSLQELRLGMFEMAAHTRIADCRLIRFPETDTGKGPLVSLEVEEVLPFPIRRMYYFKRGQADIARGNHANFENQQLIVAIQGSFEVVLMDGHAEKVVELNKANGGLLIREGIWRTVQHFSQDAIGLVLCSHRYDPQDYWGDFQGYLAWKRGGGMV